MLSRLKSFINLVLKSRFISRNIHKLAYGVPPETELTIYALCWHTMPAAAAYEAPGKTVVWAPFYPRIRVSKAGVEIGKFRPRAARYLARLWRLSLPAHTRILTSKRIHGLPRPSNMHTLGFGQKATLFMNAPWEGMGRLHLGDPDPKTREAVFLLHEYFPERDTRLTFIAAQSRRYAHARILVTKPGTDLAALRTRLRHENCAATVVTLADLIADNSPKGSSGIGIESSLKTLYRHTIRPVVRAVRYPFRVTYYVIRKWSDYYRKAISGLPNSTARLLPGPTVDLEEHMITWSHNVGLLTEGMPVDLIHSHDIISAPAGAEMAARTGAFHVVDVNEFPILSQRVGRLFKRMNGPMRRRIEGRIKTALEGADGRVAVSLGVARITRRHYGTPTLPVRNFRDYEEFSPSTMHDDWNMPAGDIALVHACTISPDYKSELLVEVLAKLPAHYHLVLVGGTVSAAYQDGLVRCAHDLGAGARLHIKGEISNPHEYISYVAGAELGIVMMTPEVPLIRFGMANRHADLFAAGLPMVSTYTIESSRILRTKGNGVSVHSLDPATLAKAIVDLREDPERWSEARARAAEARHEFTWETETRRYPSPITVPDPNAAGPQPIAVLLFQRGLIRNKRILRLGLVLQARGYRVLYLARAMPNNALISAQPDALFLRIPAVDTFNEHLLNTTRARLHKWLHGE